MGQDKQRFAIFIDDRIGKDLIQLNETEYQHAFQVKILNI